MLKIYNPSQLEWAPQKELINIFGEGGSGKSRLAASVCRSNPEKYGKMLYVATDPGGESLSSILPEDQQNLVVVKVGPQKGTPWDPYQEMSDLALGKVPGLSYKELDDMGVKTICVDTMTVWSSEVLIGITNSGKFSDKHIAIQPTGDAKLMIPMQGDYRAAQYCVKVVTQQLFRSPYHFIGVYHGTVWEPESGGAEAIYGGPATVGKASVRETAAGYQTVIRTEAKSQSVPGQPPKVAYTAWTAPRGVWLAPKMRNNTPDPSIANVTLNPDPINFWQLFEKTRQETKELK